MKKRRHHNNTGRQQIRKGVTRAQAEEMGRALGRLVARSELQDIYDLCREAGMSDGSMAIHYLQGVFYRLKLAGSGSHGG